MTEGPSRPSRFVVGAREHPGAANPTGVHGEPRAVRLERDHLLLTIKRECPAVFDELAAIAEDWAPRWDPGAGNWPPELEEWAARWKLTAPWLLERVRAVLEGWFESSDARSERSLMYMTSGPHRTTFRIELDAVEPKLESTITCDTSAETRAQARERLEREAKHQIAAYLDELFGPRRHGSLRHEHGPRWAVLRLVCRRSPEQIASADGLAAPGDTGKTTVRKAIRSYCDFIGWKPQ